MPELLPKLTQLVLLDRGLAYQVHGYLKAELVATLRRLPNAGPTQRLSETEALAIFPLQALIKRLAKLVERDQVPLKRNKKGQTLPARPHRLKMPYDQMTVVRHYYARMMASAGGYAGSQELLATALGPFHQTSLNLERHINLAPANRLLARHTS